MFMKVEYWIYTESGWQQVDSETYASFHGTKEHRPSTWRLMLIQGLLQKYRCM